MFLKNIKIYKNQKGEKNKHQFLSDSYMGDIMLCAILLLYYLGEIT